jgi:hypothetical protein
MGITKVRVEDLRVPSNLPPKQRRKELAALNKLRAKVLAERMTRRPMAERETDLASL